MPSNNEFLTVQDIARDSLLRLQNNLVMAALVHRDHSQEFASRGDTVQVKKPATFDAKDFSDTGPVSEQNIEEDKVLVKLDKIADVSVEVTSNQLTQNIQDFGEQVSEGAMQAIAQKIDKSLCELYKFVPYHSGVENQIPDSLEDIAQARRVLNENKAPFTQRRLVVDPETDAELLVLDALVHAEKSGTTDALREANIGRVMGFDTYMDQNIYAHDAGTLEAETNFSINATAGESKVTITHASVGSDRTVKKGDVLYPVDDTKQRFTVAADVDPVKSSTSNTEVTVNETVEDTLTTEAYECLDDHTANLAFHRNAFAFVNRPMALPMGGADGAVVNYNGLSIRVTMGYTMSRKVNTISYDILYGMKLLQAELACRTLGSA